MQRNAIRETQVAAARGVDHFCLYRHVSARNRAHNRAGAIEIAERQLICRFRREHIAQRIKRVLQVALFLLNRGGLFRI